MAVNVRRVDAVDAEQDLVPDVRTLALLRRPDLLDLPRDNGVDCSRLAAFATLRGLTADSKAFGLPIGAIDAIGVRRGTANEELQNLDQLLQELRLTTIGKHEMLTALVDLDRPVVLEALQRAGARVYG